MSTTLDHAGTVSRLTLAAADVIDLTKHDAQEAAELIAYWHNRANVAVSLITDIGEIMERTGQQITLDAIDERDGSLRKAVLQMIAEINQVIEGASGQL
jgi:hypothetical protein